MRTRIWYDIAHVPSLFTYDTKRGRVYVYVLEVSPVNIFGVVTFYDNEGQGAQEAYAAWSLLWASASALIKEAESKYDGEGENPFTVLLNDKTAMKRLSKMFEEAGND